MKQCTKCKQHKSLSEFYPRLTDSRQPGVILEGQYRPRCKVCYKQDSDQWYSRNQNQRQKTARAYRQANLEFYRLLKDNKPCVDCGVTYPYYVLQWDHLGDKTRTVSSMMQRYSREQLLQEIAKCELVCANCHAVRTWNRKHQ